MANLSRRPVTPLRILVVESSPIARDMIARTIVALGHEADGVRGADEAWEALGSRPIDVVIADWPSGDAGVTGLCRQLRARETDDGVPYTWFLVMVPTAGRHHVMDAVEAGADGFLLKPIDGTALAVGLAAAARFLALHEEHRAQDRELARGAERLREEERRDPLTRMGNRLRLDEDLRRVRSHVRRYGHRWTAVMLDVDQFRRYNEALGHDAGDDALRKIAKAIRRTLRDGDIAYRYEGEAFLLLLPEQGEDGGVVVAQRCRAAVAALGIVHPRSDVSDRVTLSAGVAELHGDEADAVSGWLRRADLALYAAKAQGRDGIARSAQTHMAGPESGP